MRLVSARSSGGDALFGSRKAQFGIALAASLIDAFLGMEFPSRQRPLDYHSMITVSIPLAAAWLLIFVVTMWRFGKRGLWLLAGAAFAFWWPVWMIFNDFPPCYYSHLCM